MNHATMLGESRIVPMATKSTELGHFGGQPEKPTSPSRAEPMLRPQQVSGWPPGYSKPFVSDRQITGRSDSGGRKGRSEICDSKARGVRLGSEPLFMRAPASMKSRSTTGPSRFAPRPVQGQPCVQHGTRKKGRPGPHAGAEPSSESRDRESDQEFVGEAEARERRNLPSAKHWGIPQRRKLGAGIPPHLASQHESSRLVI